MTDQYRHIGVTTVPMRLFTVFQDDDGSICADSRTVIGQAVIRINGSDEHVLTVWDPSINGVSPIEDAICDNEAVVAVLPVPEKPVPEIVKQISSDLLKRPAARRTR